MSAIIESIVEGSPAAQCGIHSGGRLIAVNGKPVMDVFDYGFLCAEAKLVFDIQYDDRLERYTLEKDIYDDAGLVFDSFLMDESHHCSNKCIFCFIDQLPKGMREPLYFKDDDARLSYLFGNYITLTNLTDADVERIISMHISPINISVHTTDPELRCKMMNNRFAGEKLKYLRRFAEAQVEINCQIVLCRDYNDGDALRSTLEELASLYPSVRSVAVVPVGLTDYRDGLTPLRPFDRESAARAIDIIESVAQKALESTGTRLVYPADEFFLISGRDIPPIEYYDELLQLENGVGMIARFTDDFVNGLSSLKGDTIERRIDAATGVAASEMMKSLAGKLRDKFPNTEVCIHTIENDFFGKRITVAGLVTGRDLVARLSNSRRISDRLLIPASMLRREGDVFLDDMTPAEAEEALGMKITATDSADELLDAILKRY